LGAKGPVMALFWAQDLAGLLRRQRSEQ